MTVSPAPGGAVLTARDYYKHFVSIWGALAGLVGSFPLISEILRESLAPYIFPPLGQLDMSARLAAVILGVGATFVVYTQHDRDCLKRKGARRRAVLWVLGCSMLTILVYLGLHLAFVREINIPAENTLVVVSVGFERTTFATTVFPQATDYEMLRQQGFTEEQIGKLWTPKSILISRLTLFLAYVLTLGFIVAMFSLGVLYDLLGPAS